MSSETIAATVEEAWSKCLQQPGALLLPIANFVAQLREDKRWNEDDIRQVVQMLRERLQTFQSAA